MSQYTTPMCQCGRGTVKRDRRTGSPSSMCGFCWEEYEEYEDHIMDRAADPQPEDLRPLWLRDDESMGDRP